MNMRDARVRAVEDAAEVAKWDFVVRELEVVLERSRRERLVVEGVERVLRRGSVVNGGWRGAGKGVRREKGERGKGKNVGRRTVEISDARETRTLREEAKARQQAW